MDTATNSKNLDNIQWAFRSHTIYSQAVVKLWAHPVDTVRQIIKEVQFFRQLCLSSNKHPGKRVLPKGGRLPILKNHFQSFCDLSFLCWWNEMESSVYLFSLFWIYKDERYAGIQTRMKNTCLPYSLFTLSEITFEREPTQIENRLSKFLANFCLFSSTWS